jgi:hypothetical protein
MTVPAVMAISALTMMISLLTPDAERVVAIEPANTLRTATAGVSGPPVAGEGVVVSATMTPVTEEAARLEKEIAAHPVTRCEPGARNPSSWRRGWSSKPFIPRSEQIVAEGIAKKIMRKAKPES